MSCGILVAPHPYRGSTPRGDEVCVDLPNGARVNVDVKAVPNEAYLEKLQVISKCATCDGDGVSGSPLATM